MSGISEKSLRMSKAKHATLCGVQRIFQRFPFPCILTHLGYKNVKDFAMTILDTSIIDDVK